MSIFQMLQLKEKFSVIFLSVVLLAICVVIYSITQFSSFKFEYFAISTNSNKLLQNIYPVSSETYARISKEIRGFQKLLHITEIVEMIEYDMLQSPDKMEENFECVFLKNTDPPYHLCLMPKDGFSKIIKSQLKYTQEESILKFMKDFFIENPDAMFFDLGMNIGLMSLYAATICKNCQILAIDPNPRNHIIVHKAVHLNNYQDRFRTIIGAVSNRRGEESISGGNTGMHVLSNAKRNEGVKINSVTLNDLTPLLTVKKALLKMDIEGYECQTFENAEKLFNEVDIPVIIMEIGGTRQQPLCCFERMLKFLQDRNYQAFYFGDHANSTTPLDFSNWRSWDFEVNIYFKKLNKKL